MFFHVDESGNTGNNLFDSNQPKLSYGLLYSAKNVDAIGANIHTRILERLKIDSIHASVLGVDKLTQIADLLLLLQEKMKFEFDYYFIEKQSFALVLFFDAVFDAGINEAVKWDMYWTPLRYPIIYQLSTLFDEALLKEAWELSTNRNIEKHSHRIVLLLNELLVRTEKTITDARFKEIISDGLKFGIANPLGLDLGTPDSKLVSPNAIGFQFVVKAIARKLQKKRKKKAKSIVVDRQNQFNPAQKETHDIQRRFSEGLKQATPEQRRQYTGQPLYAMFDESEVVMEPIQKEISISASYESIGLQIVDVYLWVVNRLLDKKPLSNELRLLANRFMSRSLTDGISMEGMSKRWENYESLLPKFDELGEEQLNLNEKWKNAHRQKVRDLNL
jgi:hypothetical protein